RWTCATHACKNDDESRRLESESMRALRRRALKGSDAEGGEYAVKKLIRSLSPVGFFPLAERTLRGKGASAATGIEVPRPASPPIGDPGTSLRRRSTPASFFLQVSVNGTRESGPVLRAQPPR